MKPPANVAFQLVSARGATARGRRPSTPRLPSWRKRPGAHAEVVAFPKPAHGAAGPVEIERGARGGGPA